MTSYVYIVKTCPACKVDYDADAWVLLPLFNRGPEHPDQPEPSDIVEIRVCDCGKLLTAIVAR